MTEPKEETILSVAGKNLLVISLTLWIITNLTHTYFRTFFPALSEGFGKVVYVQILPLIGAFIYLWLKTDSDERISGKSILKNTSSALILVLAINGIQSLYSNLELYQTDPDEPASETIPLLSARPWLPSLTLTNESEKYAGDLQIAKQIHLQEKDSLTSILAECGIMTDSVFLVVVPNTKVVATGGHYESEVVLAAKIDSNHVKSMSVNGRTLPFRNGIAHYIESPSTGNRTHNLQYEAEVMLHGEEIRKISFNDSYRTVASFIEVSSQAINSLYRNCGNRLSVQVPALGNDYNPKFTMQGGQFRYGNDRGFITVLPTGNEVRLGVYNGGIKIGERSFPVRNVPPPIVKIYVNGNEVDLKKGIIKEIPILDIRAVPNPDFARIMPQDSRYKVTACEISLISGGIEKASIKDYGNAQIKHLTRLARKGDYLEVEVEKVERMNFKGDIEVVQSFSPRFFSIPLL